MPHNYHKERNDILEFLKAGDELGINIPSHLKEKIDKLDDYDKLKVALIGGFSEGKTSLAAAWLGTLPKNMKISHAESSNEVAVYDVRDDVQLIDTPGLFGFKKAVTSEGEIEKYKEITRKYVSEANIVLYVLSPSNPVKESHRDELNWLFRDLSLLARTIFVINRFDMIADIEDEEEYLHNLNIKKKTITKRLEDIIGLTAEEKESLSIVGIAANPFDEGLESWQNRPEEHTKLSRIDNLRQAVDQKVAQVGGAEEAKRQTCITILKDVTERQLVPARLAAEAAEREAAIADGNAKEEGPRLNRYKREAGDAQAALSRILGDYFTDIIVEAKNTSMKNFGEFYERHIGKDGIQIETQINIHFSEQVGAISGQLVAMSSDFIDKNDGPGLVSEGIKTAAGHFKGSVTNTGVKAAREWIMPSLKFKPYGAIKAANFTNKALGAVGVAMAVWETIDKQMKFEEFEKDRQKIVQDLKKHRSDILRQINSDNFISTHFPQIEEMQNLFAALKEAFLKAAERNQKIQELVAEGENLRLRFDG